MFLQLFMLRTLGPYLIQIENEFNVLFFRWGTHLNTLIQKQTEYGPKKLCFVFVCFLSTRTCFCFVCVCVCVFETQIREYLRTLSLTPLPI